MTQYSTYTEQGRASTPCTTSARLTQNQRQSHIQSIRQRRDSIVQKKQFEELKSLINSNKPQPGMSFLRIMRAVMRSAFKEDYRGSDKTFDELTTYQKQLEIILNLRLLENCASNIRQYIILVVHSPGLTEFQRKVLDQAKKTNPTEYEQLMKKALTSVIDTLHSSLYK